MMPGEHRGSANSDNLARDNCWIPRALEPVANEAFGVAANGHSAVPPQPETFSPRMTRLRTLLRKPSRGGRRGRRE